MTFDLNSIVAIDVHAHSMVSHEHPELADDEMNQHIVQDAKKRWKTDLTTISVDETAAYYRERNMMAVIFTVDSESGLGERRVPNREVLDGALRNPDALIPFASIDPWKGRMGVAEAKDLIAAGVKGFKFHPSIQAFYPNDRRAYALYEVIAEAGLTALFHSGQTGVGKTSPGGGGVRLKYSNPMFLDDVAADFPDMSIIIAHPSFPWQQEALAVALHKQNVYIDLSGWSPKYFPEELVHYSNTLLKHKILFGSDFPLMTPDRWIADFEQREFRDEVRPLILKANAAKLFGFSQ
ncbi:MAG: amidohydrolase family protein [Arthrobacter sp.]